LSVQNICGIDIDVTQQKNSKQAKTRWR